MADFSSLNVVPVFIVAVLVFTGTPTFSVDQLLFRRRLDFDPPVMDTAALAVLPSVRGKLACFRACGVYCRCMSVFVNTETKECRLCKIHFPPSQVTRHPDNWRLFELEGPPCPSWLDYVHRPDLGLCYKICHDVLQRWGGANSACQAEGGHLLAVDSLQKQDLMAKELSKLEEVTTFGNKGQEGFYLDGRYNQGVWTWASRGQPVVFSAWFEEEYAKTSKTENFMIMSRNASYRWASVDGSFARPFVCEVDVPVRPGCE